MGHIEDSSRSGTRTGWSALIPDTLHLFLRNPPQMTRQEWDDLYVKLYSAYEFAGLRDEYVRSTLGDALDHMIALKSVTFGKLAHTP